MIEISLYQPEIAQNTGALLRTVACWGVRLHIIRPCGYPINDAKLRRAAMDYIHLSHFTLHDDWTAFYHDITARHKSLVLATPSAISKNFTQFMFQKDHSLLLGRESNGVPDSVSRCCPHHVHIPMAATARSLNLAVSGAILLSEALRQLDAFPSSCRKHLK